MSQQQLHDESPDAVSQPVDFDPFASAPDLVATAPATESQQEIWTAASLGAETSCAYNESICLYLQGALDAAALQQAVREVVNRHESLRASFGPDGEALCVAREIPLDTDIVDVRESGVSLDELRDREVTEPFDLVNGPLCRVRIVRIDDERHVLVFTAHHTVCDGWSFGVLLRELARAYDDFHQGRSLSLPAAPSFSDYASRQHEHVETAVDEQQAWWLTELHGAGTQLELPTDFPRSSTRSPRAGFLRHTVPDEIMQRLRERGARRGVTAFTVIASSMAAYLHRLTGKDDLIIGVPAAGQAKEGLEELVGHCVSLLPVRSRLDRSATFDMHLDRFGEALSQAWEHRDCSMGRIVRELGLHRDIASVPLVQLILNVDRPLDDLSFAGLEASFEGTPRRFENFEMFINVVNTSGGLRFDCTYDATLFCHESVRNRFRELEAFLERVSTSDAPLQQVSLVTPDEERTLREWGKGASRDWIPARIEDLVRRQCERTPSAVAVECGNTSFSYRELDTQAEAVAGILHAEGVAPGDIVGVLMERDAQLPAALLGILRAGAAYLPLDSEAPVERVKWMLEDAGARLVVANGDFSRGHTDQSGDGTLADFGGRVVDIATPLPSEWQGKTAPVTGNPPDNRHGTAILTSRSPNLTAEVSPDDPAYVIYTSGSTGKPKGVVVPHRAVGNFLFAMQELLSVKAEDRFLALTTLSFDIAVLELWLPLVTGASVHVVPREVAREGDRLRDHITRVRPTVMQATPATWQLLIAAGWEGDRRLQILSGGEALPVSLATQLIERAAEVRNMYGPTETTVWSTSHLVEPDDDPVPIGSPIANTTLHVLDASGLPVPPGVPGELYIGGAGVADGYLNRSGLTSRRFVKFAGQESDERLYRTGDRVRFNRAGRLEYLGRTDFQIKLRGYRIEPGEIEAVLESHSAVRRAVVVVREVEGDPRLVAYVTLCGNVAFQPDELRTFTLRHLPAYMLPQHFMEMDRMPLTPSGKIDRAKLPSPEVSGRGEHVPPAGRVETGVAEIWREVLGVESVSAGDDFFSLGGHSLLAARVVMLLRERLHCEIPIASVFECPVLSDLARYIEHAAETARVDEEIIEI